MSLSDDVLADGRKLAKIREALESLVEGCGATAGFLVDEEGNPFATVGHVEFQLPHPLATFLEERQGAPLLGALLGESDEAQASEDSGTFVERLGERALLVLLLDAPLDPSEAALVRSRARSLAALL